MKRPVYLGEYAMDNTIIYATCDNDGGTACFIKYIILALKWLTKGPKHVAKLQTSYFDLCTVHRVQFIIQTNICTTHTHTHIYIDIYIYILTIFYIS